MNLRQHRPGEGSQVISPAAFDLRQQESGFSNEAIDVDRHAGRPVRLQLLQSLAQLDDGPMPVAITPVVEADANLEDALVEVADRVGLPDPDPFQGLVLLEEFLLVELFYPGDQRRGRRVIASGGSSRSGLSGRLDQALAWLPTDARTLSPSGDAAGSSR